MIREDNLALSISRESPINLNIIVPRSPGLSHFQQIDEAFLTETRTPFSLKSMEEIEDSLKRKILQTKPNSKN